MYGLLEPGSKVEVVGNWITVEGDAFKKIYCREYNGGKVCKTLYGVETLTLHPAPPVYLPQLGLFSFVYIPIDPPITLAPFINLELEVDLSIDIAVSAGGKDVEYLDIFSTKTPKMAVYGHVSDGLLGRYMFPVKEAKGPGTIKIPIRFNSDCNDTVDISKIVMPALMFHIYYKPGTWECIASPVDVQVECDVMIIKVFKYDPPEGFIHIPIEREDLIIRRTRLQESIIRRVFSVPQEFIMDRGF